MCLGLHIGAVGMLRPPPSLGRGKVEGADTSGSSEPSWAIGHDLLFASIFHHQMLGPALLGSPAQDPDALVSILRVLTVGRAVDAGTGFPGCDPSPVRQGPGVGQEGRSRSGSPRQGTEVQAACREVRCECQPLHSPRVARNRCQPP